MANFRKQLFREPGDIEAAASFLTRLRVPSMNLLKYALRLHLIQLTLGNSNFLPLAFFSPAFLRYAVWKNSWKSSHRRDYIIDEKNNFLR